jgi:ABC-type Na+ efflux pump permease subunit
MALKAGARRIADALRFHKGGIDAAHAQGRTTSHVAVTAIPAGELSLSLAFMCIAILVVVWVAARIYRAGILMFGKKPTWTELYRWIRQA